MCDGCINPSFYSLSADFAGIWLGPLALNRGRGIKLLVNVLVVGAVLFSRDVSLVIGLELGWGFSSCFSSILASSSSSNADLGLKKLAEATVRYVSLVVTPYKRILAPELGIPEFENGLFDTWAVPGDFIDLFVVGEGKFNAGTRDGSLLRGKKLIDWSFFGEPEGPLVAAGIASPKTPRDKVIGAVYNREMSASCSVASYSPFLCR